METSKIWIVVIVYLALSIGVGVWTNFKEQQRTANGFFHSSLPPVVIAFTLVGAFISGVQVVGIPATVNSTGLGTWLAGNGGGMIGVVLGFFLVGKPMRKIAESRKVITLPDMLVDIYKYDALRTVAVAAILVWTIGFATSQWVSLGQMCYLLLGISYERTLIVGAVIIGLYTVLGGNKSTAIVSAVQMLIAIIACSILVIVAIRVGGGMTNIVTQVNEIDPDYLKLTSGKFSSGWNFWNFVLLYGIGFLGQPQLVVKYFQIKDAKLLPKCLLIAVASLIPFQLIGLVGLTSIIKLSTGEMAALQSGDSLISAFIATYSNSYVGGLMVAACLAAIMTTISALLITASSALVKDIMAGWFHVDISGKKGVSYSRIALLLVIVVSVLLAMNPTGNAFEIGSQAYGGYAAVFAPAIVASLRWRRSTKQGVFWSMIVGLLMVLIPTLLNLLGIWTWSFKMHMGLAGIIAATVVLVVVSLATPAQEKEVLPLPRSKIKELYAKKMA